MGLQAEKLEVPSHAGLGDTCLRRHCSHAPMRRAIGRLGVQRGVDQVRYAFVIDRSRLARPRVVVKAGDASFDKPCAPLSHRSPCEVQSLGNGAVEIAIGTAQDDACSGNQGPWQRPAARERLELRTLLVRQQINATNLQDRTLAGQARDARGAAVQPQATNSDRPSSTMASTRDRWTTIAPTCIAAEPSTAATVY